MPFAPTDVHLSILRALEQMQCHGCDCASETGEKSLPHIRLESGIHEALLQSWLRVSTSQLRDAMLPIKQRGFVRQIRMKIWPIPAPSIRLFRPDGQSIILRHWRGDLNKNFPLTNMPGVESTPAPASRRKTRQSKSRKAKSNELGFCVEAIVGTPRGTHLRKALIFPSWHANDWGPAWLITEKGMDFLDHAAEPIDTLDELVTLNQISPLAGVSKRTLERWLRNRMVPRPDINGGGGTAHKWYWNNIRPHLEELVNRRLPTRFHGSRII